MSPAKPFERHFLRRSDSLLNHSRRLAEYQSLGNVTIPYQCCREQSTIHRLRCLPNRLPLTQRLLATPTPFHCPRARLLCHRSRRLVISIFYLRTPRRPYSLIALRQPYTINTISESTPRHPRSRQSRRRRNRPIPSPPRIQRRLVERRLPYLTQNIPHPPHRLQVSCPRYMEFGLHSP